MSNPWRASFETRLESAPCLVKRKCGQGVLEEVIDFVKPGEPSWSAELGKKTKLDGAPAAPDGAEETEETASAAEAAPGAGAADDQAWLKVVF